jgi:lipopolysaccharide export system protein LptA
VIALIALQLAAAAAPGSGPSAALPATHIDAARIEYLSKQRRTVMTGDPLVTLRRDDASLVCRKLVAESDGAGDVVQAVCEGDVKITRGEKTVTCDRATYDAAAARIVCQGEPVLRDGRSVLHCDEVTYDLRQDRVVARRGKGTLYPTPALPVTARPGSPREPGSPGSKGKAG